MSTRILAGTYLSRAKSSQEKIASASLAIAACYIQINIGICCLGRRRVWMPHVLRRPRRAPTSFGLQWQVLDFGAGLDRVRPSRALRLQDLIAALDQAELGARFTQSPTPASNLFARHERSSRLCMDRPVHDDT